MRSNYKNVKKKKNLVHSSNFNKCYISIKVWVFLWNGRWFHWKKDLLNIKTNMNRNELTIATTFLSYIHILWWHYMEKSSSSSLWMRKKNSSSRSNFKKNRSCKGSYVTNPFVWWLLWWQKGVADGGGCSCSWGWRLRYTRPNDRQYNERQCEPND